MKLHLGCGKRFIPGYAHIDAVQFPHVDVVHAVDNLPMIADDLVEVIYSCHVLEHFTRVELPRVLAEWRRVLKPGGTLRVAVPDFEAICELYRQTKRMDVVIGPLFGRGDHLYNIHHNVFDFPTLATTLVLAGFTNVRRYDWRKTEHADVDDFASAYYPHMDKERGLLLSLNVEATK